MANDWKEVCDSFGEPTVDAKDYSYTTRRRAYWTNFTIPMLAFQKDPKMNWDECMDEGRTLGTKKVYGIGKPFRQFANHDKEIQRIPLREQTTQ